MGCQGGDAETQPVSFVGKQRMMGNSVGFPTDFVRKPRKYGKMRSQVGTKLAKKERKSGLLELKSAPTLLKLSTPYRISANAERILAKVLPKLNKKVSSLGQNLRMPTSKLDSMTPKLPTSATKVSSTTQKLPPSTTKMPPLQPHQPLSSIKGRVSTEKERELSIKARQSTDQE